MTLTANPASDNQLASRILRGAVPTLRAGEAQALSGTIGRIGVISPATPNPALNPTLNPTPTSVAPTNTTTAESTASNAPAAPASGFDALRNLLGKTASPDNVAQKYAESIGDADPAQSKATQDSSQSHPPAPAVKDGMTVLREATAKATADKQQKKNLATMRTMTQLLTAVYANPGSKASVEDRVEVLSALASNAQELGVIVANSMGIDLGNSEYRRACATDAAVQLVTQAWGRQEYIDWPSLLDAANNNKVVTQASEELAKNFYLNVNSEADAMDRIAISMHSVYWRFICLGEQVNGMTKEIAGELTTRLGSYLQRRDRFSQSADLNVSWFQGSIQRMADLACAELSANYAKNRNIENAEDAENSVTSFLDATGEDVAVSAADLDDLCKTIYSGFEGVESFAQNLLQNFAPRHSANSQNAPQA
jgi:hypothetical protein